MSTQLPANVRFTPIDAVGVEEKIARITKRSIKNESKLAGTETGHQHDATTLEAKDTPGKVRQLCAKAIRPHQSMPDIPSSSGYGAYPPGARSERSTQQQRPKEQL